MNFLPRTEDACPVCREGETRPFANKKGFVICRCDSCGSGFLDTGGTHLDVEALYQDGYFGEGGKSKEEGYDDYLGSHAAFARTFQDRVRDLPGATDGDRPRLLDVGCGPGFFLEQARPNFDVAGVELSRFAANHARSHFGLEVRQGMFHEGMFAGERFDVVTMWDVIEHFADPERAIADAASLLKDGGCLVISTGDFASFSARLAGKRWHLFNVPEHLFYFSARGLRSLLSRHGLAMGDPAYPRAHYTMDYLCERGMKTLGLGALYARAAAGLRRTLQRWIVPFNLFDIMVVSARKAPGGAAWPDPTEAERLRGPRARSPVLGIPRGQTTTTVRLQMTTESSGSNDREA